MVHHLLRQLDIKLMLITLLKLKWAARLWSINTQGHMTQASIIYFYFIFIKSDFNLTVSLEKKSYDGQIKRVSQGVDTYSTLPVYNSNKIWRTKTFLPQVVCHSSNTVRIGEG